MKEINPYKQHGMTCAIACMLMVLEYYKIIPKANYLYEQKYYKSYRSKYMDGTPFSALAWHFSKSGLNTEIIHSEKEIFINNIFDNETFENLMEEYKNYLKYALEKGCIVNNGINIDINLLKQKLDEDKLIILAGQINNILHAILLIGYENNNFIVIDPLYKKNQTKTFDEINIFMNTPIGKWCVIVNNSFNMIRKANPNDSEIITRIHTNSWKTTYKEFFPEEIFVSQKNNFDIRNTNIKNAIIKDDEYHYIVYEEDNKILGFASYGASRGDNYKDMGEVYSIYIEKENQRKGIGKKLINECFYLLKKDYNTVIIRCLKGNFSEAFYKKMGGKIIDSEIGKVGNIDIVENIYKFDI